MRLKPPILLRKNPFLLLLMTGLLVACDTSMTDLQQFVAQTKQRSSGDVEPLPEFPKYESFIYDSTQLRDPFKELSKLAQKQGQPEDTGPRPDAARQKQPLEFFPLDSLKMVGVLRQKQTQWGLVKAPDGAIHRVLKGHYAGKNHGKIENVNETQIALVELVPDGLGNWVKREAKLSLGEE